LVAIVCIIYKDAIYKWYICGLNMELKRKYPGVLSTWAATNYN